MNNKFQIAITKLHVVKNAKSSIASVCASIVLVGPLLSLCGCTYLIVISWASHTLKNGPQGISAGAKLSLSSGLTAGQAQLGRRDYSVSSKLLAVDKSRGLWRSRLACGLTPFCQMRPFTYNIHVTHPLLSLAFERAAGHR
jgi:hypothetical protein